MSQKVVVRCQLNRYATPLFSYDQTGIYLRCKDCRSVDAKTGEVHRGTYHLITWSQLLGLALSTVQDFLTGVTNDSRREGTSSDNKPVEEPAKPSDGGGGGDSGGQLHEPGLQVPSAPSEVA